MKYRLIKRAKGWAVQAGAMPATTPEGLQTDERYALPSLYPNADRRMKWRTLTTYRHRFLAALHLLWLRERNRK